MSIALRIILIVGALFTFLYILRRVKKCDMSVGDTVFWILFSVALMLFAIFPVIAYFLADLLGFSSPINFIFIFVIAVLVLKIFSMSVEISRLKSRIATLAQNIGLDHTKDR